MHIAKAGMVNKKIRLRSMGILNARLLGCQCIGLHPGLNSSQRNAKVRISAVGG